MLESLIQDLMARALCYWFLIHEIITHARRASLSQQIRWFNNNVFSTLKAFLRYRPRRSNQRGEWRGNVEINGLSSNMLRLKNTIEVLGINAWWLNAGGRLPQSQAATPVA
jgi:hypothetical protein